MAKVVIFGLGDYAEVARAYLTEESAHDVVGFTVEEAYLTTARFAGLPTFPFERIEHEVPPQAAAMLVATGPSAANQNRARFYAAAKTKGYTLISHVSPKAIVWPGVPIGENSVIFEGCILEPFTSVGDDTILWSGVLVAHHSQIGNHCFLAPRVAISGRVVVEDHCFLGINSTVRDHVRIGAGCVVGAGALITKDTEPGSVYASPRSQRIADDSTHVKL
jgi:sugar O-acyltransferase (sialic acid O-acetyltransferase NeuD family)